MTNYASMPEEFISHFRAVVSTFKASGLSVKSYLNGPSCPYSIEMREVLSRILPEAPTSSELIDETDRLVGVADVAPLDKFDVVLAQIEKTMGDVDDLQETLDGKVESGDADSKDLINLIRARTTLFEKWTQMQERIFTLKEMSEFQAVVVRFMDDLLDVDQIAELKKRLRSFRSLAEIEKMSRANSQEDE